MTTRVTSRRPLPSRVGQRQGEVECRATPVVGRGPDRAAVSGHDRGAQRQPQADPGSGVGVLRGPREGLEDPLLVPGLQSPAVVGDLDPNPPAVAGRLRTSTEVPSPGREYLTALPMRLRKSCRTRAASARTTCGVSITTRTARSVPPYRAAMSSTSGRSGTGARVSAPLWATVKARYSSINPHMRSVAPRADRPRPRRWPRRGPGARPRPSRASR